MVGGKGSDIFIFESSSDSGVTPLTRDIIKDFVVNRPGAHGPDQINLSGIDANQSDGSINDTFTLIDSSSSFWAAGQLKFDASTHVLYSNIDKNFSTVEFSIKLLGVTDLQTNDLVL